MIEYAKIYTSALLAFAIASPATNIKHSGITNNPNDQSSDRATSSTSLSAIHVRKCRVS
ncbi:MAG: hypothetical protein WCP16_15195 [Pseudanabaena sp. ELA645]